MLLLAALAVGCGPVAPSPPVVGRTPYQAFPNTYTLTNGRVVVVVAPAVGRIVGYHRVGEPNRLWLHEIPSPENELRAGREWVNYGGDKVWVAPQSVWLDILGADWPPDTTTDGDSWTVLRADPRELTMSSGISVAHGVRVTRTLTLPDRTTTVRIHHRLERVLADSSPVQVWTVSQVHWPDFVLLDRAEDRPLGTRILRQGKRELPSFQEIPSLGIVRMRLPQEESVKIGVFGRWIAAVGGSTIFAQYAALDPQAEYDDLANCVVYADPQAKYVELELLSPTVNLPLGEALEFTVTWKLLDRPLAANDGELVRLIESNAP